MKNTGFEITFDIFDTGYKIGDLTCFADECLFIAYPEPHRLVSRTRSVYPSLLGAGFVYYLLSAAK